MWLSKEMLRRGIFEERRNDALVDFYLVGMLECVASLLRYLGDGVKQFVGERGGLVRHLFEEYVRRAERARARAQEKEAFGVGRRERSERERKRRRLSASVVASGASASARGGGFRRRSLALSPVPFVGSPERKRRRLSASVVGALARSSRVRARAQEKEAFGFSRWPARSSRALARIPPRCAF